MSTLRELAVLIIKRHVGGMQTFDNKVTERQVIRHILQQRDSLMNQVLYESMKNGEKELDPAFVKTYTVDASGNAILPSFDNSRDVYFITLPTSPASVINDMGVYNIRPMKGHTLNNKTEYVRVANGAWSLLPKWFDGMVCWTYKGSSRVEFPNMTNIQAQVKLVLDIIPESISDIDMDEPLPMPTYLEAQIVENILKLLGMKEFDAINNE